MWHEFHFLRPWWFLLYVPILLLGYQLKKNKRSIQSWRQVCDPVLLKYLLKNSKKAYQPWALYFIMMSFFFLVMALAGPTWLRRPVPVYAAMKPHVIVLDLSEDMLKHDLHPSRLARAKYKIRDLLEKKGIGQFGLMVYTSEPFVVSPLTTDGQTIIALLPALEPNIMPIQGNQLDLALKEIPSLLLSAGGQQGEILVLTGNVPSHAAIEQASQLAQTGSHVSVIPMLNDSMATALFKPLSRAGNGHVIPFSHTNQDINEWLSKTNVSTRFQFQADTHDDVPLWYDEGRWFLLLALIFLAPIFRRGWLQRLIG